MQVRFNSHYVVTLLQSGFDYRKYPNDKQTINLDFFAFSLFSSQIRFNPVDVSYMYASPTNYENAFAQNPLWTFISFDSSEGVSSPGPIYSDRPYGSVQIAIQRKPDGIVLRLAVPVFLLVVLAALSFWADPEDRVNSTVTMLLAISALYIVVFQNIPMIGYLTVFDTFIISMFSILFGCCILHLLTIRLQREEKVSKWPLRKFYIRLLEMAGRCLNLPLVTMLYLLYFNETMTEVQIIVSTCFIVSFVVFVTMREYQATAKALKDGMAEVKEKFEQLSDLSSSEILLFNIYVYRKFSRSLNHHIRMANLNQQQQQQRDKKKKSDANGETNRDSDDSVDGIELTENPVCKEV